jgi:hypothetical protein
VATDVGHDDVGEEEVELGRVFAEAKGDGFGAAWLDVDFVAEGAEDAFGDGTDGVVVLDEEDAFAAAEGRVVFGVFEFEFGFDDFGDEDGEGGALAELAGAADGAVDVFEDDRAGSETEACARPLGLVVKKGSKRWLWTSGLMPMPVSLTESAQ